jgi:hypothetical protein
MTNNLKLHSNLFKAGSAVKERLLGLGSTLNGLLKVKLGRPFLKVLLLLPPVVGVRRNLSLVKVLITYLAHLHRLQKQGGFKFLVIYLKACYVLLQQSVGGQRLGDSGPLGARVSRTRSGGLPRVIPVLHRKRIREGETAIIKLWLSLFSVYRVLDIKGKVKTASITEPFTGRLGLIDELYEFIGTFIDGLKEVAGGRGGPIVDALWGKGITTFLPALKAEPELLSKSSPVVSDAAMEVRISSTSPLAILLSARTWSQFIPSTELGEAFASWCRITGNRWILDIIEAFSTGPPDPRGVLFKRKDGGLVTYDSVSEAQLRNKKGKRDRYLKGLTNISWTQWLGKLGTKVEAAGKVRVFAMVDCFTQWIFRPLHDAIFQLLKTIQQDGTHDQVKPLVRLLNRRDVLIKKRCLPGHSRPSKSRISMKHYSLFSYDLTAATDRLPVAFQEVILGPFLGSGLAGLWRTILVGRDYYLVSKDENGSTEHTPLRYAVGQPMGALSSWAMLALTHHCIVQWAWYRVCKRDGRKWSWYKEYAVLGDDIVLLGSPIAGAYRDILHSLGVQIGHAKSLISKRGIAVEFAKRTFYKKKDVSAVSLKECLVAKRNISAGLELCRKHNLTLGAYCKFLGYGYKSLGSLTMRLWSMPSRLRNYVVAYTGPGMPSFRDLVSWLTQKSILKSYGITELAMSQVWDSFVQVEKQRLLDHLEKMERLYAKANIASAQYREGGRLFIAGCVDFPYHPGIKGVEGEVLDLLNSVVYWPTFVRGLGNLYSIRNQVTKIGEYGNVDLVTLWDMVDKLDRDSALIPRLADVTTTASENTLGAGLALVERWVRYSRPFRSTTKGPISPV